MHPHKNDCIHGKQLHFNCFAHIECCTTWQKWNHSIHVNLFLHSVWKQSHTNHHEQLTYMSTFFCHKKLISRHSNLTRLIWNVRGQKGRSLTQNTFNFPFGMKKFITLTCIGVKYILYIILLKNICRLVPSINSHKGVQILSETIYCLLQQKIKFFLVAI